MTIETVIEWLTQPSVREIAMAVWTAAVAHVVVYVFAVCMLCKDGDTGDRAIVRGVCGWFIYWPIYVPLRSIWRWVAGRRKKRVEPVTVTVGNAFVHPDCTLSTSEAPYWPDFDPNDHIVDPNKMVDRQYQGDQVTGMRKELMALEERVERLEKPPQPARYRVFREPGGHLRLSDGAAVYFRGFAGWANSHVPLDILKGWSLCGLVTELTPASPEYRDIVASFEAWRKGQ